VFPEDGTFRYTLVVRSPSFCLTHYSSFSGCGGEGHGNIGWVASDLSYDGTLVIDGDALRFTLPPASLAIDFTGPLNWAFQRTRNRLGGHVSGTSDGLGLRTTLNWPVAAIFFHNGALSGASDNQGHFDGTFDGDMNVLEVRLPLRRDVDLRHDGL
jgi:hypothetical protein